MTSYEVCHSAFLEVVVQRLYSGKRQLNHSLEALVLALEEVLDLDEAQRQPTVLRLAGGAGDDKSINAILQRGDGLLTKVKNWKRVHKLIQSVKQWLPDRRVKGREVGWVERPHAYARPTRQVAARKRDQEGKWCYYVLVFNLPDAVLFQLAGQTPPSAPGPQQVASAAFQAYDRRGGGVERQTKGDKGGLGLSQHYTKRLPAQEMLV